MQRTAREPTALSAERHSTKGWPGAGGQPFLKMAKLQNGNKWDVYLIFSQGEEYV